MNIVSEYLKLKNRSEDFLDQHLKAEELLFGDIKIENVEKASLLIDKHIKEDNKILVYVDYDCDGATSAAVIDGVFRILGFGNYTVLVNSREYGNGINDKTVEYIENNNEFKLLLTADHGTSNDYHIGKIKELGLDVIITDHHQLPNGIAPANADILVNPQQDNNDHFKCLSGCAVAFFTMYDLASLHYKEKRITKQQLDSVEKLLDLVAISTIGDMMDLSNPVNRAITSIGMEYLNESPLGEGFKQTLKVDKIDSTLISFNIVPMINACSRMGDAQLAYITLIGGGKSHSVTNEEMYTLNQKRKLAQNKLVDIANRQLKANKKTNVILLPNEGNGINGIIASKLANDTKKPTVAFVMGEIVCSGSGRAYIPDLDIKACFDWIRDKDGTVFHKENGEYKYGGHSGAAGCGVYKDKLEIFQTLFEEYVTSKNFDSRKISEDKINQAIDITNVRNPEVVLREIEKLEPFGKDWENPLLLIKPETIKNVKKTIVSNGALGILSFTVSIDDTPYDFKYFYNPNTDLDILDSTILCKASIKRKISFMVDDFIPN